MFSQDDTGDMDRLSGPKPLIPKGQEDSKYMELTKDKPIRLQVKILIPIKDYPRYNFVGKLLGPKGNSLKRLQEETMTKMAILGRGSMRDKNKEEELRKNGDPKHQHLSEDLHVEVNTFAPPSEAYARISHALSEIRKFLVPEDENDEIRQTQLQELAYINGSGPPGAAPGGIPRGGGRGGRGAPRAISSRPGPGGMGSGRGLPPTRGGAGAYPPPMARAPAPYRAPVAETQNYDDGYEYQETYDQSYEAEETDGQYYDYGQGAAADAYEGDYGSTEQYGANEWRAAAGGLKVPPARATTRGAFREHPYPPPPAPRY